MVKREMQINANCGQQNWFCVVSMRFWRRRRLFPLTFEIGKGSAQTEAHGQAGCRFYDTRKKKLIKGDFSRAEMSRERSAAFQPEARTTKRLSSRPNRSQQNVSRHSHAASCLCEVPGPVLPVPQDRRSVQPPHWDAIPCVQALVPVHG